MRERTQISREWSAIYENVKGYRYKESEKQISNPVYFEDCLNKYKDLIKSQIDFFATNEQVEFKEQYGSLEEQIALYKQFIRLDEWEKEMSV